MSNVMGVEYNAPCQFWTDNCTDMKRKRISSSKVRFSLGSENPPSPFQNWLEHTNIFLIPNEEICLYACTLLLVVIGIKLGKMKNSTPLFPVRFRLSKINSKGRRNHRKCVFVALILNYAFDFWCDWGLIPQNTIFGPYRLGIFSQNTLYIKKLTPPPSER